LNDNRINCKEEEQWIVFDGDMDAKWIEDMNSVMDDSKLLTLSGSDRIMLLPHCKLVLESEDLAYSSKATISRTGVV
jgi:dynein heavy chain